MCFSTKLIWSDDSVIIKLCLVQEINVSHISWEVFGGKPCYDVTKARSTVVVGGRRSALDDMRYWTVGATIFVGKIKCDKWNVLNPCYNKFELIILIHLKFHFFFLQRSLQVLLRLIHPMNGNSKEFVFSPHDSAADVAQHVFDNWPQGRCT